MNISIHDVERVRIGSRRLEVNGKCFYLTTITIGVVDRRSRATIDLFSEEPIFDEQTKVFLHDRKTGQTKQVQSEEGAGCGGGEDRVVRVKTGTPKVEDPSVDANSTTYIGTAEADSIQM